MDRFLADFRIAVRALLRQRGFTVVAVLTLGLGIGATTAASTVVYSGLLQPLPFPDDAQLMGLEKVWGPNWFGDDHLVDVHVSNLRRKLADDPRDPDFVCTVRGVGYRMGAGR